MKSEEEHGHDARISPNVLKFGPIHEFFRPVLHRLLSDAFPNKDEAFPNRSQDNDLLISYGGEYLRFLTPTVRLAEELAHGGTIVVLRDEETVKAAIPFPHHDMPTQPQGRHLATFPPLQAPASMPVPWNLRSEKLGR